MARLGIRPGEVRALNVSDYRDGWLTIAHAMQGLGHKARRGPAKERNVRRLPVTEGAPDLAEWLESHVDARARLRGRVPLFARNRDRRWTYWRLRDRWVSACDQVGVQVSLYEGTKHALATALLNRRGVSLDDVQRVLGHKDRRSTERYAKFTDQAVVETLRRR